MTILSGLAGVSVQPWPCLLASPLSHLALHKTRVTTRHFSPPFSSEIETKSKQKVSCPHAFQVLSGGGWGVPDLRQLFELFVVSQYKQ